MNFAKYREKTQYEGVYKYKAPKGYHWQCMNDNFGKIVWGGKDLMNPYVLVKDENYEEMADNNTTNNNITSNG